MSSYPNDLSHLDREFGETGRMRDLAGQVWAVNAWIGGDLYDVVEDWPYVPQLEGVHLADVPGLVDVQHQGELLSIVEDERMALHLGFGGTEDEVLALRAKGTRYTLRRNA